ncbi:MAG: hypothetical protein ABL951_14050 [Alphaproteobacteria bacterium]
MTGLFRHWRGVVRLIGAALVVLGSLALLSDLHITGAGLAYRPIALGQYWHDWHAPSLNLFQAIVERYILPQLWTYGALPLLLAPAWIVVSFKGVLLAGISYVRISAHRAVKPAR